MITLTFDNMDSLQAEEGLSLEQLLKKIPPLPRRPLAAIVNGKMQELDYPLFIDSHVRWLDYNSNQGWRIYRRSLVFLLELAVQELFSERALYVSHSLSEGFFCWLNMVDGNQISAAEVEQLEQKMRQYVQEDLKFHRTQVARDDAATFFRSQGKVAKARMIEKRSEDTINIYEAGGLKDFCYGKLAPSASYVDHFHLLPYDDGFVVRLPAREYLGCVEHEEFQHKHLQTTLAEYHEWSGLMGIRTVSDLNDLIDNKLLENFTDLVLIAETLQERNLHRISDAIYADFPQVRLILLAGPSSSGKNHHREAAGHPVPYHRPASRDDLPGRLFH